MISVPWWMLSPSPYSLAVWSLLAYFQTKRLSPSSIKEWINGFSISAFSLGLIVLPFDSLWVIFQCIRFGYLFPNEIGFTLSSSLLRNLLFILLCVYNTREIHEYLNLNALMYLMGFIPLFALWFGLAPDPSWTDWTYAFRFSYGIVRTFNAFLISHGVMKLFQSIIFYDLWRVKTK